jgi:hypothetical protein
MYTFVTIVNARKLITMPSPKSAKLFIAYASS